MKRTDTVIVGGGQAGLAMSRCLSDRGIEHVVLERGRIAERWRSERWESLRLLTPNWQSRLPGFAYSGPDPDGYMTMSEVVDFFERYAQASAAPVEAHTAVRAIESQADGFRVTTDRATWRCGTVVIATGHSALPAVPALATNLPGAVAQVVPPAYRRASDLPAGGVLVVGASASGIQLAQEVALTGRRVLLAVGHHTRVPRRYRGKDVLWWLDRMGIFDETEDDVYDIDVSREQASFQLIGSPDHRTIDLAILQAQGVEVVGHVRGVDGYHVAFEDDLVSTTAAADVKLAGLLRRIDRFIDANGLDAEAAEPFEPIWRRFTRARRAANLQSAGIRTVLWATGFRREYAWLRVPALDRRGDIRHNGGVTPVPGLYVVGLQFLRRRNSSFIDGVGRDAQALASHIAGFLDGRTGAVDEPRHAAAL